MIPLKRQGALFGLAAALLFGISPPLAKLLLPESGPMVTAGLLDLGAAREAGFFATAPFIGAVVAVPVLGERWDIQDATATALMMAGVALLLRGRHAHAHRHEEVEHDHSHQHEEHHDHEHDEGPVLQEPHAHVHWHLPLTHDHPHLSELHHRHDH